MDVVGGVQKVHESIASPDLAGEKVSNTNQKSIRLPFVVLDKAQARKWGKRSTFLRRCLVQMEVGCMTSLTTTDKGET